VEWWSRSRLAGESSLPHSAAILSRDAAEIDPYRFAYGMLLGAEKRGAKVHDRTTVTGRTYRRNGVELRTSRDRRVRARHLVVASGYEADDFLIRRVGTLLSTFALVSEPVDSSGFAGWPANRALIWDTADPYLYLRTTPDHRAIIGGYDEPFRSGRARDQRLAAKCTLLRRRFRQLFPQIALEVATAWAGTFGISTDALPFIGQHPGRPHTWLALGFGGNGITFSLIAGEIIRAGILGDSDPDAALFGFERLA
jgi:glycine/D-amino acid oxidase-like deaminating enzyme